MNNRNNNNNNEIIEIIDLTNAFKFDFESLSSEKFDIKNILSSSLPFSLFSSISLPIIVSMAILDINTSRIERKIPYNSYLAFIHLMR